MTPTTPTLLSSIAGTNIKGRNFRHELRARTAIVGRNMTGKSAIVDAIRLVCLGHLPEVGKRPSSTFELSSGHEMFVVGDFDNGDTVARRFYEERGSVKSTVTHGTQSFLAALEALPLMNAQAYFEMTPAQQIDYVFRLVTLPEAFTKDGIVAEAQRLSLGEEHTEAFEKAKQATVAALPSGRGGVQQWLADALATLAEYFTNWNARARATQGAVTTLTELKLRAREFTADTLAQLGNDLRAAEATLAAAQERSGELRARSQEAARVASRRQTLDAMLADPYDAVAKTNDDITAAQQQIATQRAELEKLTPTAVSERGAVADAITAKGAQQLREAIEHAAVVERRQGYETSIAELEALDKCPTCKAANKGWKSKVLRGYNAELEMVKASETRLAANLRTLDEELKELREKLATMDAATAGMVSVSEEIKALERKVSELSGQLEIVKRRRDEAVAERDALTTVEAPTTADVSENSLALADATEALTQLRSRRDTAVRLQHDIKRAAEAEQEHVNAAAYVVVIKALQKLVAEKRAGMVDAAFGELLKVANRMGHGILKSPLAFHDGNLGRWTANAQDDGVIDAPTRFIPHRVFSGTEKVVAYIGLAAALSAQAPLRLAIIDEFGRLDSGYQEQMIANLSNAVWEHVIDQFVLVTPSPLPATLPVEHALDIINVA